MGDTFIVDDLFPSIFHELWNIIYPYVFALQNGAELDCDDHRAKEFDSACADGSRVKMHESLRNELKNEGTYTYI